MSLSDRVVGRFWKSVGRRLMSEGGEYSDGCEYELSWKGVGQILLVGKYVGVNYSHACRLISVSV